VEPWQQRLAQGDALGAWDLFDRRYRRLIVATIRRLVPDEDDVMDVFSTVCHALSADDCARLRRYSAQDGRGASVATWTIVVVRNLAVEWLRRESGRRRVGIPAHLTPLQQAIYRALCVDGCSPTEAYEVIHARGSIALTFAEFLRETRATLAIARCPKDGRLRGTARTRLSESTAAPEFDPAERAELATRIADVLATQPADVRLAVELFVVERLSADDVARVVDWPNAKSVYNRVYRALNALRAALVREGIGPGDL